MLTSTEDCEQTLRTILLTFVILLSTFAAAQDKIRIALTPRSNISSSEIGKGLDQHCPNVITDDPQKAAFTLEAWDTGAGAGRKPYKFTVFKSGDRVYSTETRGVAGAVKDVCGYISSH